MNYGSISKDHSLHIPEGIRVSVPGGRSVGIVRSRTQTMEFSFSF
jgi:hypothetical protein